MEFLAALLAKILSPLIEKLVDAAIKQIQNAAIQIQINSLEKSQAELKAAWDLWNQAKTPEEKDAALSQIASNWNKR